MKKQAELGLNLRPADRARPWKAALGFLALHTLVLLVLQLALGGLFMQQDRGNAFAGVNLVVALFAAPVLLVPALPLWLLLHAKSRWPHRLALLVSLVAVLALQLFLRSAPPPVAVSGADVHVQCV
jgi:hypothetical protein